MDGRINGNVGTPRQLEMDIEQRGRSRGRDSEGEEELRHIRSSSFSDFSSPSPTRRPSHPAPSSTSSHQVVPTKVFIENLTRNVNQGHLLEIFGVYGRIRRVFCKSERGWAAVEYEGVEAVERAILCMDGGQIDGDVVKVSVFRQRHPDKRSHEQAHHRRQRSASPRHRYYQ